MGLLERLTARAPDLVIGGFDDPYLLRWYLTPWRGWHHEEDRNSPIWWKRARRAILHLLPNVYVHRFLRSDDDRALHDHPWLFNASLILRGAYTEHMIAAGGVHHRRIASKGQTLFRFGRAPHRVELHAGECWTLFVTGPVLRDWGFHCKHGWVPWRKFTAAGDPGAVGKGCDQ